MWDNSFEAMEENSRLDDQAIFWNVLRRSTDPIVKDFYLCSDTDPVFMANGRKKNYNFTTIFF